MDFADESAKESVTATYISNGNYDAAVTTAATWGSSSTLNTAGTPGVNEFSLKAWSSDNLTAADLVTTTAGDCVIDNTGDLTTESGDSNSQHHPLPEAWHAVHGWVLLGRHHFLHPQQVGRPEGVSAGHQMGSLRSASCRALANPVTWTCHEGLFQPEESGNTLCPGCSAAGNTGAGCPRPVSSAGPVAISGSFYTQKFEIPVGGSVDVSSIYVVAFNQGTEAATFVVSSTATARCDHRAL